MITPGKLSGLVDPAISQGRESFDVDVASDWNLILENTVAPPQNIEVIRDGSGRFAVMHPAKRFGQLNNRMTWIPSAAGLGTANEVKWTQLACKRNDFNGSDHLKNLILHTGSTTTAAVDNDMDDLPTSSEANYGANYHGPEWRVNFVPKEPLSQSDDPGYGATYTLPTGMVATQVDKGSSMGDTDSTTGMPAAYTAVTNPAPTGGVLDDHVAIIEQYRIFDKIWWGVETTPSLPINIPIYVQANRDTPRIITGQPGCLIVRINPPTAAASYATSPALTGQSLDLVFENGKTPLLYDWSVNNAISQGITVAVGSGSTPASATTPSSTTFAPLQIPMTTLGVSPPAGELRIGFLPVCGRLAIFVNGAMFLYSRPVPAVNQQATGVTASAETQTVSITDFAYSPFNTKIDKIQVYGTNCQAMVALAAMRFAVGMATLPVSGKTDPATGDATQPWNTNQVYRLPASGVALTADAAKNNTLGAVYGASFRTSFMQSSSALADSVMQSISYVGYGHILMVLNKYPTTGNAQDKTQMYQVLFYPDSMNIIGGNAGFPSATNGPSGGINQNLPVGPPFLQRLRSSTKLKITTNPFTTSGDQLDHDISQDVVSVSENWSSPDRVLTAHTLELTLYNDQGQYDFLLTQCCGVRVCLGWQIADPSTGDGAADGSALIVGAANGTATGPDDKAMDATTGGTGDALTAYNGLVFTGATYGGSSTVTAGRETVTIQCQDYMAVLEQTPIINSPYYDGCDIFDAVQDLAERGRIEACDDTSATLRYYLPSGYSWTQPALRFKGQSTLKDNLNELVKLGERVLFFDEYGVLHLDYLQGGLFGIWTAASDATFTFYRYPGSVSTTIDPKGVGFNTLLNERKIDYKLSSAVNSVLVRTVDRLSGSLYTIVRTAPTTAVEGVSGANQFPYKKQLMADQPALGSIAAGNNRADQLLARLSQVPRGLTFSTLLSPNMTRQLRPMDIIKVEKDRAGGSASYDLMRVQTISRQFEAESNSLETSLTCEWYGTTAVT